MTLGNMRANGVRSLDVWCWQCHHRAIMNADPWPEAAYITHAKLEVVGSQALGRAISAPPV
jgi:hypothetical protein